MTDEALDVVDDATFETNIAKARQLLTHALAAIDETPASVMHRASVVAVELRREADESGVSPREMAIDMAHKFVDRGNFLGVAWIFAGLHELEIAEPSPPC